MSDPVKQAMIDWWGPIILEYYSATEAMGVTFCDSAEWLSHHGTVGGGFGRTSRSRRPMREVSIGQPGKLWFKTASPFEYFHDPLKTAEANSPDRTMSTVGDIGHVDADGYVYLTDRSAFMIISGGVNIYPQECENLLVTHPKVADAAVFGAPNEEMGEEVKAVVQLMPKFEPGPEMEAELIGFCRDHLSHHKCPRSIDFEVQLPRLPTGKLYKGPLRERYWKGHRAIFFDVLRRPTDWLELAEIRLGRGDRSDAGLKLQCRLRRRFRQRRRTASSTRLCRARAACEPRFCLAAEAHRGDAEDRIHDGRFKKHIVIKGEFVQKPAQSIRHFDGRNLLKSWVSRRKVVRPVVCFEGLWRRKSQTVADKLYRFCHSVGESRAHVGIGMVASRRGAA